LGFLVVLLYVSASIPTPGAEASSLQPAENVEAGQELRLLASALFNDGRARFYRYTTAAAARSGFS
jgi:hypothetical protein